MPSWIVRQGNNQYLNNTEQENNAQCFFDNATSRGYSLISICGMLGCITVESTINPGAQNYNESVDFRGLGLCQWTGTRHTRLIEYCNSLGLDSWADGNAQMNFMDGELHNSGYSVNYEHAKAIIPTKFRFSNGIAMATCTDPKWTLDMATAWWLGSFEMGGGSSATESYWSTWWETRYPQAQRWYEFLSGQPVPGGRRLPIWLLKYCMDTQRRGKYGF